MRSRCRLKYRPPAATSPAWSPDSLIFTLKKWTELTPSPATPLRALVAHCRAGHGPAFVHAHVIRPYSHSLSDDERLYRPDAERQRDAQRDPITRMQMFLIREGILDEKGINLLEKQVDDEMNGHGPCFAGARSDSGHGDEVYLFTHLDPTSSSSKPSRQQRRLRQRSPMERRSSPRPWPI